MFLAVVDLLNKNEIDFYGPKQSEEAWVVAKNIIEKKEKLVYEREPLDIHFRLKGTFFCKIYGK